MKKFLAGLVVLFILMVSVPFSAEAHSRCRLRSYSSRRYSNRNVSRYYGNRYAYNNAGYRTYASRAYVYQRPSFYQRHRNLINLGIGTGGGAIIGALAGGRRGALIGTGIGAGSSALYTYVLKPKRRTYYRR